MGEGLDACAKYEADPPMARWSVFKPLRCIKASFYIPVNKLNFPTTKRFRIKISMELV